MKSLYAAIVAFIVASACAAAVTDADIELLYRAQSGNAESMKALENLSSRTDAVAYLKGLRHDQSGGNAKHQILPGAVWAILVATGDRATILERYAFSKQQSPDARGRIYISTMLKMLHPAVISVLGEDLEREPATARKYVGDGPDIPVVNAAVIVQSVAQSGFFPKETAEWAQNLWVQDGARRPDQYLEPARAFYRQNAQQLAAGEYSLVKPPRLVALDKGQKKSPDGEVQAVSSTAHQPASQSSPPTSSPAATAAPSTLDSRSESSIVHKSVLWVVAAVAVAIGISLLVRERRG